MENKSARISVIMGIYNCSSTLSEALDSLLNQTYQGFKVIMCDDGSTDDTYKVAKRYSDKYPDKFILIRNKKNLKLAATLNHCLEYADTEYVARMDGDDLCDPRRFQTQIDFLDQHPEFSHVSTGMKLFDDSGIYSSTRPLTNIPTKKDFLDRTPYFHAPSMLRKRAYEIVGQYTTDSRVERVEDYYLWYKFHVNGLQGYNLPDHLYLMRNDKNAYARRKFKDRLRVFKLKREILVGLGVKFGLIYALRDLAKGLIPSQIIRLINNYFNRI